MTRPIAALRHRLTLQAPDETDDGAGGVSITWRDVATLWAAIRPLRGGPEGLWAAQPATRLRSEITIRYRPGLWPQMRFVAGDRVWNIIAVFDPDGRRARLICLCEELPL